MAEDIKKDAKVVVLDETAKVAEKKEYKVKKEFTYDKLYMPGNKILLEEGKLKDKLISNKFI